jgi:hypothetical protein
VKGRVGALACNETFAPLAWKIHQELAGADQAVEIV